MQVWKTLKLFVSSTFLDLELERDTLSQIFQRCKGSLIQRQLSLIPYDLRWRARDSDAPLAQWCVEMVCQCEFFIGILGSRYGWRPPLTPDGSPNKNRISITEMEINQALSSISREKRFFCFLKGASSSSEEDSSSMEALKNRLRSEGEEVRDFTQTSEMLSYIEEKINKIFNQFYPLEEKVKPLEYGYEKQLEEIIEQKKKGFVGRQKYLFLMSEFTKKEKLPNYLVLCAPAGVGKSSLLASFIDHWRKNHSEVIIISHFMSMGGASRSVHGLMQNLGEQLQRRGVVSEDLPEDPFELRSFIRSTLEGISLPLILVIDGVDEIEEGGQNLRWLSRNLPKNVRLLLSSRPVSILKTLKTFPQADFLELPPLDDREIQEIIKNYVQSFELPLNEAEQKLLQTRAAGNPLYLKVALEEILSSGIAVGELATSIDSLFEQILSRLSAKYGEKIIFDYLGFIAASRAGLAENELKELLASSTDDFLLEVTRQLDHFISKRGHLLQFFHPEFERNLKQRLGRGEMRNFHQGLAHYFEEQGYLYTRSLWELCYQRQWGEEFEPLLRTLCDIDFIQAKCLAGLTDSLLEDFEQVLTHPVAALPRNICLEPDKIDRRVIQLLGKALRLELRFIRSHPDLVGQSLWNRCHWYDSPEADSYYRREENIEAPWKKTPSILSKLADKWIRKSSLSHHIKTLCPLEPHLDSSLQRILRGHRYPISQVVFSRQENYLASCCKGGEIRIWDWENSEPLVVIRDHSTVLHTIAFSLDGKKLASGGEDWSIFVWESASGECLQILDGHQGTVSSLVFTQEEKLISASEDGQIIFWDVEKGDKLQENSSEETILDLALAEKQGLLASASKDGEIVLWELESLKERMRWKAHERLINEIIFSQDGEELISVSKDKTMRFWKVSSGEPLNHFSAHQKNITSLAVHPSLNFLFSASEDNSVCVYFSGEETDFDVFRLQRNDWQVKSIDLHPRGSTLACGAHDGSILLWNTNEEFFENSHRVPRTQSHKSQVSGNSFHPNEKWMISGGLDGRLILWDIQVGLVQKEISQKFPITSVAFSRDGKKVVCGGESSSIYLYHTQLDEPIHTLKGHQGMVSFVSFDRKDKKIISIGYFDNTIRLWDVSQGTCLHTLCGHEKWIESIALSGNNEVLATGARDKTIRLWSLEDGTIQRIFRGSRRSINSLAFSKDDRLLASGEYYGQISIWDTQTGACRMILSGHSQKITELLFLEEDNRLLSTSEDQSTRLWDITTGKELTQIKGQACLESFSSLESPFFPMVRDWETVLIRKKDFQEVAFFSESIHPARVLPGNYLVGRGEQEKSRLYFLRWQEVAGK